MPIKPYHPHSTTLYNLKQPVLGHSSMTMTIVVHLISGKAVTLAAEPGGLALCSEGPGGYYKGFGEFGRFRVVYRFRRISEMSLRVSRGS